MRGKTQGVTEKYTRYIGKKPSDFTDFTDKIICARVNFVVGKEKPLGLNIEQAAKKIRISNAYLCMLENDKKKVPSYIVLDNLERVYKFRPGELSKSLKAAMK